MARALLVSYAGYPHGLSSFFPDNGLAILAASLRADGHDVEIVDFGTAELVDRLVPASCRATLRALYAGRGQAPSIDGLRALHQVDDTLRAHATHVVAELAESLVSRCRRSRVQLVGFKLWSGDGFDGSVQMATRLRAALPRLRLVAGGPAVHYSAPIVAEVAPVFDAIIDGDGEEAIVELARAVDRGGLPARVTNQVGGPHRDADLAALPLPDYSPEVYPDVATGAKLKLFSLDESRGCPMRCAFCINWRIEGGRWRQRPADMVVREMRNLIETHRSTAFRLAGTSSPPTLLQGIADQLRHQEVDATFGLYLHPRFATPELLASLRSAGCYGVFFGVESGSDEVLDRVMGKSVQVETIGAAVRNALALGLYTVGSLIFPAPFETPRSEQQTRDFLAANFSGVTHAAVGCNFPGLLPRTAWWLERERYGFELTASEPDYMKALLKLNIRHLLPPTSWQALPFRLNGQSQRQLAKRNTALQRWLENQGITVNLSDHDAQVGAALGLTPAEIKGELVRGLFTGDAAGLHDLITRANAAVADARWFARGSASPD